MVEAWFKMDSNPTWEKLQSALQKLAEEEPVTGEEENGSSEPSVGVKRKRSSPQPSTFYYTFIYMS